MTFAPTSHNTHHEREDRKKSATLGENKSKVIYTQQQDLERQSARREVDSYFVTTGHYKRARDGHK